MGTGAAFEAAVSGTIIHELGHNLCLVNTNTADPRIPAASPCRYSGIDQQGPTTYVSSMNYRYQFQMVDYSTGANGPPGDHNDWGAILLTGIQTANNYEPAHGGSPEGGTAGPLTKILQQGAPI